MNQTPILYSPQTEDAPPSTLWRGINFIKGCVVHLIHPDHVKQAQANPDFVVGRPAIMDAFDAEKEKLKALYDTERDALEVKFKQIHDEFVARKEASVAAMDLLGQQAEAVPATETDQSISANAAPVNPAPTAKEVAAEASSSTDVDAKAKAALADDADQQKIDASATSGANQATDDPVSDK